MPEPVSLLMREFLAWVAARPRTYSEAMEAWRSTCPRYTVWEDAQIASFIQVGGAGPDNQTGVTLTPHGRAVLDGFAGHRPTAQGTRE
ncbi:MAG TPA: hypothetical protein VKE40_17495 [Gemmataceae bacterium]|nr:hypothetical protein [Gemmataceae bacterium]